MSIYRKAVIDALPIVREYARQNPRHYMGDQLQDPHGAHKWLEKNDPSQKRPCGECHLQKGEHCDICGAKAA
jgi:hypothetical protein